MRRLLFLSFLSSFFSFSSSFLSLSSDLSFIIIELNNEVFMKNVMQYKLETLHSKCNFTAGDDSKKHDMLVFKSCMIVPLYSVYVLKCKCFDTLK